MGEATAEPLAQRAQVLARQVRRCVAELPESGLVAAYVVELVLEVAEVLAGLGDGTLQPLGRTVDEDLNPRASQCHAPARGAGSRRRS